MKKDLEAAFARPYSESADFVHHSQAGMTLRDYFAAKAMQSLLRQYPDHLMNSPANEVACDAYILADHMLKAREA
jgi:hypothetical protein